MIIIEVSKELIGAGGKFKLELSFSVRKGEFLCLFGQSGCGKTTLLRMLAGLEKPDAGLIKVGEKIWFDSQQKINLPPQKRKIGFVFQNYSLFPNMTVAENLAYAMDKKDKQTITRLLETVELAELANRYPNTLSGGQQQRVAVARALARDPDMLLLDEPLSALDMHIRSKLQEELKSIHEQFQLTTLLVSHDKQEVFKLANRVIRLENGKMIKSGSPKEVLLTKNISAKYSFIGTVVEIVKIDLMYSAAISIGSEIVQVVLTRHDIPDIQVGDEVLVASKAFNPIIKKIQQLA
ncbi:ABC transporter-related protein [Chloroherpeton thalassium ATCC 35110]|uniref:ABC transporter-related protein n=1 Tax=Chloroherpeton thalassium (strain ATCC 35110 / GB-78) TaxID=517418 RepID=B3QUW6_CHLT3|nr:sulfate/molybdate ABC transporter ATP-binding protein [Chloroherpeton thalassium]ACF14467.1 ABC transporter-related protein [Chloroherpeton thalassium ATCC 35110]